MMREESTEEASGAGKEERSRRVMVVFLYSGLFRRARAVLRENTPVPIMRIDEGGV